MTRIRVLIIGAGSIGERHVRCFLQTGRADVSLCEINRGVRERIAREYVIGEVFDDFDSALASVPQVAVICTPAHLHVAMATRLAELGVHLLIEKPLGTSLEGIEPLKSAVAGQKRIVAGVAYVYRAHPLLQSMRAAIRSGRLGRPLEIVAVSGQDFPFYRPAYREIYYRQRETGGGAVQDALTHVVNAGEWLVGPVTALAADAAHLKLPGVEVEDTVHVIARHGAVMASYSLNQHQPANENTITAICEKGLARFEFHRQRWLSQAEPDADRQVEETCTLGRDDLFIRQANSFLDAVEGKGAVLCSLDEAIQTLRVNLAILESAETRTWQTIG